ncbi:HU family DNA-binding protein [Photobacterium toruni]|uniref:HU family DNA-binding protein n=1 Tax=Photobacterium toruni TaxID=1935446 RepID=A0ABU6L8Y1_9GAMM|nr:HU family DNA-binding protein [Photobacterium toruni]
MKLTKTDIINGLVAKFGIKQSNALKIFDSYFSSIIQVAMNQGVGTIPFVGSFSYKYNTAKIHGRNPHTNTPLEYLVGGGYKLKCSFDSNIKQDLNLLAELSKETGVHPSILEVYINHIGNDICTALNAGSYLSIRNFGTIKKRVNSTRLIFRCSSNLNRESLS